MLEYYGMPDKESELKDWYDGYLFGAEEIYNPWSVINYISKGGIPHAYWVNTGKNEILEDALKTATDDITERLYSLLQGEMVNGEIVVRNGQLTRIDEEKMSAKATEFYKTVRYTR